MESFSLILFSTDPQFIIKSVRGGVRAVIVDWEHIGKACRQAPFDTQINHDTMDDLCRVRACTDARLLCRINQYGATTAQEIEQAIAGGADEIMLPMVRTLNGVQWVLDRVQDRCGVGILMETMDAIQMADELGKLPLSRVYVGFNDLAIDRGTPNIFTPLIDGTIEQIRPCFKVPFGFGGLTLPDSGYPIPCRLLIGEMVRLKCSFSFLRRTFHLNMAGREPEREVPLILQAIRQARGRSEQALTQNHAELHEVIHKSNLNLQVDAK